MLQAPLSAYADGLEREGEGTVLKLNNTKS